MANCQFELGCSTNKKEGSVDMPVETKPRKYPTGLGRWLAIDKSVHSRQRTFNVLLTSRCPSSRSGCSGSHSGGRWSTTSPSRSWLGFDPCLSTLRLLIDRLSLSDNGDIGGRRSYRARSAPTTRKILVGQSIREGVIREKMIKEHTRAAKVGGLATDTSKSSMSNCV